MADSRDTYRTVTPYLVVPDADAELAFLKAAFGGTEANCQRNPDNTVMHAEIKIGDSIIMLGDEMPDYGGKGPKSIGGTPVSFFLYREDVDAAWKQAINAGGKEVQPLIDQFWGDRAGCLEDPFGHRWWLAQHLEDLSPEELRQRAESYFSQAPSGAQ